MKLFSLLLSCLMWAVMYTIIWLDPVTDVLVIPNSTFFVLIVVGVLSMGQVAIQLKYEPKYMLTHIGFSSILILALAIKSIAFRVYEDFNCVVAYTALVIILVIIFVASPFKLNN